MGELRYAFRRPRFPIICDLNGELVAGQTLQQFERRLAKRHCPPGDAFAIVDASGEGWAFHPELSVISPLTVDKRWTKARVVAMFNTSMNAQRAGLQYPQRSLANRRLEAVIRDVADLVGEAEQLAPPDAQRENRGQVRTSGSLPRRQVEKTLGGTGDGTARSCTRPAGPASVPNAELL